MPRIFIIFLSLWYIFVNITPGNLGHLTPPFFRSGLRDGGEFGHLGTREYFPPCATGGLLLSKKNDETAMYEDFNPDNANAVIRRGAEGVLLIAHEGNAWGARIVRNALEHLPCYTINHSLEDEVEARERAYDQVVACGLSELEAQVFMLILGYAPAEAWRYACHAARLYPWTTLRDICDQVGFNRMDTVRTTVEDVLGWQGEPGADPWTGDASEYPDVYREIRDYRLAPTDVDPRRVPDPASDHGLADYVHDEDPQARAMVSDPRLERRIAISGVWPSFEEMLDDLSKSVSRFRP